MRGLKGIGSDIEKAIFNGFSSQIKDLKLFLCVVHLQKNDNIKLGKLNPNQGTVSMNKILSDIYRTS